MKRVLTTIIMLTVLSTSFAQLVPVQEKKLWGYADAQGNVVVKPEYTGVGYLDEGYAWVNVGGKIKLGAFPEGGKWGVIDSTGQIVCPVEYEMVDLCDGKTVAVNVGGNMKDTTLTGGKWGVYSLTDKRMVIEPIHSAVSQMVSGKGVWISDQQLKKGNICRIRTFRDVIDEKNSEWRPKFMVTDDEPIADRNSAAEWYYVDSQGNVLNNGKFDMVYELQSNLFIVKKEGKYGRVDLDGKMVMECQYTSIGEAKDGGVFWAKTMGKYFLFTDSGEKVSEKGYTFVSEFYDSIAFAAERDTTCCLIDNQGKELTPFIYRENYGFHHGYATVKLAEKLFCIIDKQGNKFLDSDFLYLPKIFGNTEFKDGNRLYSYGILKDGTAIWFDEKGNILQDKTKADFGVKDIVPEGLWNF